MQPHFTFANAPLEEYRKTHPLHIMKEPFADKENRDWVPIRIHKVYPLRVINDNHLDGNFPYLWCDEGNDFFQPFRV